MNNRDNETTVIRIAHENLERLAREEFGRSLTDREMRIATEHMLDGESAQQAIDMLFHSSLHYHA